MFCFLGMVLCVPVPVPMPVPDLLINESPVLLIQNQLFIHERYIVTTTRPANPHYSENKFVWKRSVAKFSRECKPKQNIQKNWIFC